jgi:hypothetical protein
VASLTCLNDVTNTEWEFRSLDEEAPTAGIDDIVAMTPTLKTSSLLRGGPVAFEAPGAGHRHQGVDIVADRSSENKRIYQVVLRVTERLPIAK